MRTFLRLLLVSLLVSASANKVHAANYWVNWTGAPGSYPFTTSNNIAYAILATGTLFDPVSSTTIDVTYTGEVSQFSQFGGSWNIFGFPDAYLGPTVDTLPPAGNFIGLTGFSGLTNTLTFSAPVSNLLLAVASLGANGVPSTYDFDRSAVVVSSGQGQFGNGPLFMTNATTVYGAEGNGMVQFTGTFTSLSWTVPDPEIYSVFNIGITSDAVPEPGTYALLIFAAVGFGAHVWSKRRRT